MVEFKFSCPQCRQKIQCNANYVGAQINCPACRQLIVVPPSPPAVVASGNRVIQIKLPTLRNVSIGVLCILLAAGVVSLIFFALAKPKILTIKSFVDGSDIIKMSGKKLWIEHESFKRPNQISIDGKKWLPKWNGNVSIPYEDFSPAFKPHDSQNIKLSKRMGRGTVTIVEMPTIENSETLVVKIDDTANSGADWYEFTVSW